MQKFVVLAAPRTGSNLLCTLLNSHPEILCHHEIFNPQGVFLALSHRNCGLQFPSVEERDVDPLAFLNRIWEIPGDHRCAGFKWTRGQSDSVLQYVCRQTSIKKIILSRRGRIKTFVSECIAQATQQWEVYQRQELVSPRPKIAIRRDELLQHIAHNDQFYRSLCGLLEESSQDYHSVMYEDLLCRQQQACILSFLGAFDTSCQLQAASVKQNSTCLKDTIANFQELESNLQGSELLAELYECEN